MGLTFGDGLAIFGLSLSALGALITVLKYQHESKAAPKDLIDGHNINNGGRWVSKEVWHIVIGEIREHMHAIDDRIKDIQSKINKMGGHHET